MKPRTPYSTRVYSEYSGTVADLNFILPLMGSTYLTDSLFGMEYGHMEHEERPRRPVVRQEQAGIDRNC
jgi:hypothetical protein